MLRVVLVERLMGEVRRGALELLGHLECVN